MQVPPTCFYQEASNHSPQIRTYLPASDEAYRESVEERSMFLSEAMATDDSQLLSASAVQIVLVALCASKLGDIQRFDPNASSNHSAGSAWVKSQRVYSPLTEEFYVPQHLVPPLAKLDANTMFLNVSAFSGTISVYRAAKDQIGKDPISTETKQQSLKACLEAASNIVRLMEMCSDWDIRSVSCNSRCFILIVADLILISFISSRRIPCSVLHLFMPNVGR
jgi:hypothetical protein